MKITRPLQPLARFGAVVLLAATAACSAGKVTIPVSTTLASVAPLEVQGRQGWQFRPTYRFGDFAAINIRKGWVSTSGWGVPVYGGKFSQTKTRNKSSFRLQPAGSATSWQVRSAYFALDRSVVLPGLDLFALTLDYEEVYSSSIESPGQRTWQLVMKREQGFGELKPIAGVLTDGESTLQVRAVHQLMRKDGRPMNFPAPVAFGYEFVQANGNVVGAVEVINKGRVWLAPELSAGLQGPVAAAATALMLVPDSN
jgi:hypothetical protein